MHLRFAAVDPWAVAGPVAVGGILSSLVILGLVLWQKRRRDRLGIEPPIRTNLLRPPGHSLQLRLEELQEKWNDTLLGSVILGAALGFLFSGVGAVVFKAESRQWIDEHGGWAGLFTGRLLPTSLSLLLFTFASAGGLIFEINRLLTLTKKLRDLRLGLRGEQAVAEALQEVAGLGYRAFHDIPAGKTWNIDHVVVGPGGVFALETKTRSKRKPIPGQDDNKVHYDGKILRFPWGGNTTAVIQATAAAKWVSDFLRQATGRSIQVQPLLIIPGWYVERTEGSHAVKVMNTNYLTKLLAGLPPVLSPEDQHLFAHPISEKCRDVEF